MSFSRAATWVALAAITVLASLASHQLWTIAAAGRGLPLWDPADHGLAGIRLADAIRHGDLPGFLLGINRQVLWPFVHSLLLAPWVLVFGEAFGATDGLSAVLFAGVVISLCYTGLWLHPTRGAWAGVAAATLALLAPLYRLYGTLTMLEMPGAFLLALTAGLHVRACRDPAPRALVIAADVSTTALFLCKYNYGLLWLAALAIHEACSAPAARRAAWIEAARAFARSRRWRAPFPLVMLAWLLVLLGIQITGGGELNLLGQRLSIRSAGNPAYGFCVVAAIWAVVRVRRAGGLRVALGRLSERHALLAVTIVLPLLVWFLIPYPNRVRAFVGFAVNRDSGFPPLALDTLLFYPRALVHEYSPAPWLGWIVLACAAIPPFGRNRTPGRDPALLIYVAFWVGLLVTMVHPYRQPRFLFTTAIPIWLSAARGAVACVELMLARVARPAWIRQVAWAALLVAPLAWAGTHPPDPARTLAGRRAFNAPPALAGALDRVLDHVARVEERPFLLGYANLFSPALLRWQARLTAPRLAERRMPDPAPGAPVAPSDADIAQRIETLVRAGRPVIAALPVGEFAGETEEYRSETRADLLTAARLAEDPRAFRERDEIVPACGFRVTTFRFVTPRRVRAGGSAR